MTNANVMALNVQSPAPAKGGKGTAGSVLDGSSKGKFDEALGRLQQEVQNELVSAGKDDTPQDTDARDGGSDREGAPQSPLAMVMALPVQQLAAQEMQAEAPAAVADFSEGAPISGDFIKTSPDFVAADKPVEQNLRSLLPQSDEAAQKNKDFLAMLSGDLTSSQRAEAQGRTELQMKGSMLQQGRADLPQGMPLQEAAGREYSLQMPGEPRNLWQLGQPLQEAEPTDPLGAALRQAARPRQQEAVPVAEAPAPEQARPEARAVPVQAVQPQLAAAAAAVETVPARNENLQVLLGNNISVESQPEVQPLRMLHDQGSQAEMSFGQGQQESGQARQTELAAALETEETATAASQPQMAGHHGAAAQVANFQQVQEIVASADTPQAAPEPQADFEVPRQIVEQARLIRSGGDTEMVIHLKPEHLGDLTLKISVTESGAVTASFHSDNAQVRTIIENSLVQLRQELNDQGLKVDSVEVFSGLPDGQLPQGQGQQAWQQGSQGRFTGDRKPEDYAEEADDLAAAASAQGEENTADDGVDYRV